MRDVHIEYNADSQIEIERSSGAKEIAAWY
jgi:hypothetical protein